MHIEIDDLSGPEIAALLATHVGDALDVTPAGSAHALDLDGLRRPEITFWSVWEDADLLGCGALRQLSPEHGEIKSMHTAARHRGRGIADAMLQHIIAEAGTRGYHRLSLETGSFEAFAPARGLYDKYGFVDCPPFAEYLPDPNSTFMTLALA